MGRKAIYWLSALAWLAGADISVDDGPFRDGAALDYLIIAPDSPKIVHELQRLATAKWQKGLRTRIVTLERIYTTTDGTDAPERIRSYLQRAVEQWGITWVLIAGDYRTIPSRKVSAGSNMVPTDSGMPCSDLYYSCLEGTWDPDSNGIYGDDEAGGDVRQECSVDSTGEYGCIDVMSNIPGLDVVPDIYLGRIPVSNAEETAVMVDKILAYGNTPRAPGPQSGVFLFGSQLHRKIYTSKHNTWIADATQFLHYQIRPILTSSTSAFRDAIIDEMYEDSLTSGTFYNATTPRDASQVMEALSKAYNLVFLTGHGGADHITLCTRCSPWQLLWAREARTLQTPVYSNIMTLSCSTMEMRDTLKTLAKEFLLDPRGGGISYTGASGIDYASYRQRYLLMTMQYLAHRGVTRIARAHWLAVGRDSHPRSIERHVYLVSQYWGDPETQLWTRPVSDQDRLDVAVVKDRGRIRVAVAPARDSVLISAWDGGEYLQRTFSSNGVATFDAVPESVATLTITASAHNYLPVSRKFSLHRTMTARADAAVPGVGMQISRGSGALLFRFSGIAEQEISIRDPRGRLVGKRRFSAGGNRDWHVNGLAAGVYVVETSNGLRRTSRRVAVPR